MKKASGKQLQELDRIAIEVLGIPSLNLMENAGRLISDVAKDTLKQIKGTKINVVCGKGNNAGDGFVCARYLIEREIKTNIFLIGKREEIKKDAQINLKRVQKLHSIYEIYDIELFDKYKDLLADADILVDAIFGIGLKGEIKEPYKSVIKFLNNSGKQIISIDCPSGLDATTGEASGECIKATITVTFSVAKAGFFINQGSSYCGEIIVVDIGIPKDLIDKYAR